MPMVKVLHRSPTVGWMTANLLGNILPQIVADALTSNDPEGELAASDIEVEVVAMDPGLRTRYDLHIEVEANDHPERRRDLERRAHWIAREIRVFFNQVDTWKLPGPPKGWVWVKLVPAHWVEL